MNNDFITDSKGTTIIGYRGDSTYVQIPYGIKAIGHHAFQDKPIEEIYIPPSVETIEYNAFEQCASLRKVRIAEGLEEIGDQAFIWCDALEEIYIPSSVRVIGKRAFTLCESLKTVSFGSDSNLRRISEEAFYHCHSLRNIFIPKSVQQIGQLAFGNCYSLESLIMENLCFVGKDGETYEVSRRDLAMLVLKTRTDDMKDGRTYPNSPLFGTLIGNITPDGMLKAKSIY